MSINIAIADDHPLAINGIKTMLLPFDHIKTEDTYHSGKALLEGLATRQPEVLLLDILLPDISGKELAPLICNSYPAIKIIALTSLDAPAVVRSMLKRGCLGYLLKDTDERTLVT